MALKLMVLSSGDNNRLLSIRPAFFLCWVLCFFSPSSAFAQPLATPWLTWLPLLSSQLGLLQPNRHCPQNKLVDIQVSKKNNYINAQIGNVDWDLDCHASANKAEENSAEKPSIDLQINHLLQQLTALPEITVRVDSVNLDSAAINSSMGFSALISKQAQQIGITINGEQLELQANLNLKNKQLSVDGRVKLTEALALTSVPEPFNQFIDSQVNIHYHSDLRDWQNGSLSVSAQGKLAGVAEHFSLAGRGDISWLTGQLNLQALVIDIKHAAYNISAQQSWHTTAVNLTLSQPSMIQLSPFTVDAFPLELQIGRSAVQSKTVENNRQQSKRYKLPGLKLATQMTGKLDSLDVSWQLQVLKQILTGKLAYRNNHVALQLAKTQLMAKTLFAALPSYFPELQLMQLDTGSLSLQLDANYDFNSQTATIRNRINAAELSGEYDSMVFSGVSLQSELDYLISPAQLLINRDQQRLHIDSLFVGVPITEIELAGQLYGGVGKIAYAKAQLLGGQIGLQNLQLQPPSQTLINISGLQLSEMIKYSVYPEISSAGIIDGRLPLLLTEQGFVIKQGELFAREPGYIKVPENTVVKAIDRKNPAFSFTMEVLSDLQFATLHGVVDYAADGESTLDVEIKGSNPNISATRPVIFNYSHNENIHKLLQSLRFNEQLTKKIEERY